MFQGQSSVSVASNAGYMGNAVAVDGPPMGRVAEAEQETRALLDALQQTLGHLEQRIQPILRSSGPTANSGSEKANREPSAFAASLIANNQKLHALVNYVQELSGRVDL